MKKVISLVMVLMLMLSISACGEKVEDKKTVEKSEDSTMKTNEEKVYKIGMLQFVEHVALDAASEGFKQALADNDYVEGKNIEIDAANAQGDMSNCETVATKFVNDGVDLIFANATPAAQACAAKTESIPIVITSVTDPESAGLVETNELSKTNVVGTSDLTPIKEQIELLFDLIPDAKTVAIMYSSSEDNSIFQKDIAKKELESRNIKVVEASVSDTTTIQSVTESLIGKVDAVYIGTDNLLAENMGAVSNITNENGIPVIVGEQGMASNGGLATYGINYYNLGYKTGEIAVEVLKGKNPKEMGIYYLPSESCELIINKETADELGITIPEEILEKATILE